MLRKSLLQLILSTPLNEMCCFISFNSSIQKRWKKPIDSARTRLESRTRDLKLDKLMNHLKKLGQVIGIHELMSKRRGHYTSVQLLSRWRHMVDLNTRIGDFIKKYPHIFEVYIHPVKKIVCCKITQKMVDLFAEEAIIMKESEQAIVQRLKKLLLMSTYGTLHLHALWLIRKELGLPDDFRDTVIPKYPDNFTVEQSDTLVLKSVDGSLAKATIEKWREKEYREKWLNENETKFAFPIQFPTGFKIGKGMREKLKNWQMLPYLKPYERYDLRRSRNVVYSEKCVVGILHEFLSLTVEKMVEVERLAHFKRDFNMKVNVREVILKHPGIFYISTKGKTQTVILREGYNKGCLVEHNSIYAVRRKMLDLLLLGNRNTVQMQQQLGQLEERCKMVNSNHLMSNLYIDDRHLQTLETNDEDQTTGLGDLYDHFDEEDQR